MSSSLMAEDECEVELRDMVTEVLENNGVLPKLRAQLRASVFLALDETAGRDSGDQSRRFQNEALRAAAAQPAGRRCLALVRELLACLQLDCTLSVLDAELEPVAGWREERPRLAAALGVSPAENEPVLAALLAAHSTDSRSGGSSGTDSGSGSGGSTTPPADSPPGIDTGTGAGTNIGTGTGISMDTNTGTGSGTAPGTDPEPGTASASASDDEDSFFDSLPKVRSVGVTRPGANPPLPPVRRPEGELPPLAGGGTLPPLRHGQLPSLSAALAPAPAPAAGPPASEEHSISEELEPAGDSILSDLQSDGLTDDVSINSTADLKADFVESM